MIAPSTPIRVLVAEDVPAQRKLLVGMLARDAGLEVVAEAANGLEAVEAVRAHRPDLLFLDVQMPELDAFQVIDEIGVDRMPFTIFVTAYDAYALRAFEVHAVDYLLKPFDEERLAQAVRHAVSLLRVGRADAAGDLAAVLQQLRQRQTAPARITVRVGERVLFLDPAQIDWIEADGKLAVFHAGKQTVTTREPLGAIERRLDPAHFLRVHRSAIVNLGRIQEMQPWFKGDYVIVLRDGTKITSGRAFRDVVRRLIAR